MYILRDGTEVTIDQIHTAFAADMAVIVYNNADNHTASSLMLDGKQYDTRDECHSVWGEMWTATPTTVLQCYAAASA